MLCSVHGTSGTLMGAVLCIITKCDLPAAPAVFTLKRPAVILP